MNCLISPVYFLILIEAYTCGYLVENLHRVQFKSIRDQIVLWSECRNLILVISGNIGQLNQIPRISIAVYWEIFLSDDLEGY